MSFTVCASDHPIADLVVSDGIYVTNETPGNEEPVPEVETEAPEIETEAPEDTGELNVPGETDEAQDGDILTEDESSGDSYILASEDTGSVSGISFSVSSLTITDFTELYYLDVVSTDDTGTIDPERLSYSLLDKDGSPVDSIWGVSLKREEASTGLIVDATACDGYQQKFFIIATYDNSEGEDVVALLPVMIRNVPTNLGYAVQGFDDYDAKTGTYIVTDESFRLFIEIYSTEPQTHELDLDKFTWTLTENGEEVDPEERGLNYFVRGNYSVISADANFNGTAKLNLTATYSNTFTDASGSEVSYPDVSVSRIILIDTRPFRDTIEIHSLVDELTLKIDSPTNTIPFEVRYIDTERGYPPEGSYSSFECIYFFAEDDDDRELLDYLTPYLDQSVPSVNVRIADEYLYDSAVIEKILDRGSITVNLGVRITFPGSDVSCDYLTDDITINFESGTPDGVNGIKLNTTALTITDFTQSYPISTVTSDGEGTIVPSKLVYSLLDEDREKVDSIDGVSLLPVADTAQCVLDVSEVTENTRFYVDASYVNSEGTAMNATIPVLAQIITNQVDFSVIPGGSAGPSGKNFVISGKDGRIEFDLCSVDPAGVYLDGDQVTWDLLENGKAVNETRGINFLISETAALMSIYPSGFNGTGTFEVVAVYNNSYIDAAGKAVKGKNLNATCTVIVDTRTVEDTIEAHFPDSSTTVQLYNATNDIPFVIRFKEADRGTIPSGTYEIDESVVLKGATAADQKIINYLNVTLRPNGQSIVINLPKTVVNNKTILNEIIKKKSIKASLTVGLTFEESGEHRYYSTENITISFGTALPTVKSTKVLEFDSFRSPVEINLYQGQYVDFIGADVDHFEFADPAAAKKSGLIADSYHNTINITEAAPAKARKKTVKVRAFIDDSNYRLPDGYNVTVPVTYTILDGAPTLTVGSTSCLLNTFDMEMGRVTFNMTGNCSYAELGYKVLDSKGKDVTSNNYLYVDIFYKGDGSYGYVMVEGTSNTVPGQTYKLSLFPEYRHYSYKNGKTGKAKTITIKTVAEKSKDQIAVTAKTKGAIDASIYGSAMNITFTGKNTCLDYQLPDISVFDSKMTNITDMYLLNFAPNNPGTGYIVTETVPFTLLAQDLAGQKVTVLFDYGEVMGKPLNATCSFKIGKSTVTPKLNLTSVSYNPAVPTESINATITNLPGGTYDYIVAMTCGKENISLGYSTDVIGEQDVICIGTSELGKYAGKTISVKITPVVPSDYEDVTLPAKAATLTIKVLSPAKTKVSVTGKVKGSIDAVRDTTNATITLTYKNLYDPESILEGYSYYFFQQTKSGNTTCDGLFYVDPDYPLVIRRNPGSNIPAGTYKATVTSYFKTGEDTVTLSTVVTFKVVRGSKTGVAINPESGSFSGTTGKLINREYTRKLVYNATVKDLNVNSISRIALGGDGKFDDTFILIQNPFCPWSFSLYLREGYVEMSKGKAITKAVTKTVPIEIYYEGSNVPDKINIKVMITP
jgi:hypothetical protein